MGVVFALFPFSNHLSLRNARTKSSGCCWEQVDEFRYRISLGGSILLGKGNKGFDIMCKEYVDEEAAWQKCVPCPYPPCLVVVV